jgi:hypothetical protein
MISSIAPCLRRTLPRATFRYHATGFHAKSRVRDARGNATASKPVDKKAMEKLPLAGIRVLDMTRVLAGVGNFHFEQLALLH